MNENLVRQTEAFLKRCFDEGEFLSARPEEKAYRLEHTYRVANLGREIAKREGLDETGLVIACLLHDVSYGEGFGENEWKDHGRRSAGIARLFLEDLGLPAEQIDEICFGIAIHVDDEADFPGQRTPFALSVGDADNLDRFDVYRVHEALARSGFLEKPLEEKLRFAEHRLARLRELLDLPMATKAAEAIWRDRLSFQITFYEKLIAQLTSSTRIL